MQRSKNLPFYFSGQNVSNEYKIGQRMKIGIQKAVFNWCKDAVSRYNNFQDIGDGSELIKRIRSIVNYGVSKGVKNADKYLNFGFTLLKATISPLVENVDNLISIRNDIDGKSKKWISVLTFARDKRRDIYKASIDPKWINLVKKNIDVINPHVGNLFRDEIERMNKKDMKSRAVSVSSLSDWNSQFRTAMRNLVNHRSNPSSSRLSPIVNSILDLVQWKLSFVNNVLRNKKSRYSVLYGIEKDDASRHAVSQVKGFLSNVKSNLNNIGYNAKSMVASINSNDAKAGQRAAIESLLDSRSYDPFPDKDKKTSNTAIFYSIFLNTCQEMKVDQGEFFKFCNKYEEGNNAKNIHPRNNVEALIYKLAKDPFVNGRILNRVFNNDDTVWDDLKSLGSNTNYRKIEIKSISKLSSKQKSSFKYFALLKYIEGRKECNNAKLSFSKDIDKSLKEMGISRSSFARKFPYVTDATVKIGPLLMYGLLSVGMFVAGKNSIQDIENIVDDGMKPINGIIEVLGKAFPTKDPDKEKPKDPDKEKPKDPDKEKPKDPDKEKPKDPDKEKPKDPDKEKPEHIPTTSEEIHEVLDKDYGHGPLTPIFKAIVGEVDKDPNNDNNKLLKILLDIAKDLKDGRLDNDFSAELDILTKDNRIGSVYKILIREWAVLLGIQKSYKDVSNISDNIKLTPEMIFTGGSLGAFYATTKLLAVPVSILRFMRNKALHNYIGAVNIIYSKLEDSLEELDSNVNKLESKQKDAGIARMNKNIRSGDIRMDIVSEDIPYGPSNALDQRRLRTELLKHLTNEGSNIYEFSDKEKALLLMGKDDESLLLMYSFALMNAGSQVWDQLDEVVQIGGLPVSLSDLSNSFLNYDPKKAILDNNSFMGKNKKFTIHEPPGISKYDKEYNEKIYNNILLSQSEIKKTVSDFSVAIKDLVSYSRQTIQLSLKIKKWIELKRDVERMELIISTQKSFSSNDNFAHSDLKVSQDSVMQARNKLSNLWNSIKVDMGARISTNDVKLRDQGSVSLILPTNKIKESLSTIKDLGNHLKVSAVNINNAISRANDRSHSVEIARSKIGQMKYSEPGFGKDSRNMAIKTLNPNSKKPRILMTVKGPNITSKDSSVKIKKRFSPGNAYKISNSRLSTDFIRSKADSKALSFLKARALDQMSNTREDNGRAII